MSYERLHDVFSRQPFGFDIKVNEERNAIDRSSTNMDGGFHYFQLFMDELLGKNTNSIDQRFFIEICKKEYENDKVKLAEIELFENSYICDDALRWYTKTSFLSALLNKTLRMRNIHFLTLFGFFIRDIHDQLVKLQAEQSWSAIQVYRGQLMSSEEIGLLMSSEGQLVSMNSLLSTTPDLAVALAFRGDGPVEEEDEKHRVLLTLDIDPKTINAKPFANIRTKSFIPDEDEVLFMLGSVFSIDEVRQDNDGWYMHFTLCGCKESDEEKLVQQWKKCLDEHNSLKMLYLNNAKKFQEPEYSYRRFSHTASSLNDSQLDEYDDIMEMNQRILDMFKQTLEPTHPTIIACYNRMGLIDSVKGNYIRALISYEKALHLLQTVCDEDNEKIALCLHNIAHQHMKQNTLKKALLYEQQALDLMMKVAPTNHRDLITAHMNMADIHTAIKNLDLALNHLEHALKMSINSLPEDRVSIGNIYHDMAAIYRFKGDHRQAGILLNHAIANGSEELLNLLPFLGETGKLLYNLSNQQ